MLQIRKEISVKKKIQTRMNDPYSLTQRKSAHLAEDGNMYG